MTAHLSDLVLIGEVLIQAPLKVIEYPGQPLNNDSSLLMFLLQFTISQSPLSPLGCY